MGEGGDLGKSRIRNDLQSKGATKKWRHCRSRSLHTKRINIGQGVGKGVEERKNRLK